MKTTMITMFDINSIKSFDVFSFEVKGEQKGLGFVINGKPYLLWTHVYQNLEINQTHALTLINRLTEGNQFISFTNSELKEIKACHHVTWSQGFNASNYYFLTEEGFNRIIMEVDTSRMKDKKVAAAIETRKNEMARVFTAYETGTLALPEGKKPRSRRIVEKSEYPKVSPVLKDYLAAGRSLGLDKRTAAMKALELTEKKTGEDLSTYKDCLPLLPAKTRGILYSSSAIAEKFGKSKRVANQFLADNGLLVKIGRDWGFSVSGEKYGEMDEVNISSGRGSVVRYAPRWKPEVIDYLKKNNPVKGQKTLA